MSLLPSNASGILSSTVRKSTGVNLPSTTSVAGLATSAATNQLKSLGISSDKLTALANASGASKLLGSSVSSIAAKFPSTSNLFGNLSSTLSSALTSNSIEAKLGTLDAGKKFDDLSKSLNNNVSSMDGGAVTYSTNTSAISVERHKVDDTANETNNLLDLPSASIAKLADATGLDSISNNKELFNAQSIAFKDYTNIQSQALGNADNLLSDVKGLAGGTVGSLTGSTLSNVNLPSEFPTTPDLDVFDEVDLGADSLTERFKIDENPLVNTDDLDLTTDFTRSVSDLSKNGLPFDDIPEKSLEMFQYGNDYPKITDPTGQRIPGISNSRASQQEASGLYSLAALLCSNVNQRDMYGYGNNKNMYDYMVGKSSDLGLSDLLMSLLGCNQYRDTRTQNILSSRVPSMARNGDVSGLHAVSSKFGPSSLHGRSTSSAGETLPWRDKETLLATSANMDYDDEDTVGLFEDMAATNGIDFGKYCYDEDAPVEGTIDASSVAVMSNKSNYFSSKELGAERAETVLGVFSYYA